MTNTNQTAACNLTAELFSLSASSRDFAVTRWASQGKLCVVALSAPSAFLASDAYVRNSPEAAWDYRRAVEICGILNA